jgi:hypothetical protein
MATLERKSRLLETVGPILLRQFTCFISNPMTTGISMHQMGYMIGQFLKVKSLQRRIMPCLLTTVRKSLRQTSKFDLTISEDFVFWNDVLRRSDTEIKQKGISREWDVGQK